MLFDLFADVESISPVDSFFFLLIFRCFLLLTHDGVDSFRTVMHCHSFYRGVRVDGEGVRRCDDERIVLHNVLFLKIKVLFDRRLVVDGGGGGGENFDACKAGSLRGFSDIFRTQT